MTVDRPWKVPESVLVVIHDQQHRILLLERADHPGFWQSVTGSLDTPNEPVLEAARREVREETGIDCPTDRFDDWGRTQVFEIFAHWRHRYAPGVTHNTEHVLSLIVPSEQPVQLAPREHLRHQWLDWRAAAETCFSWTNAEAIRQLVARQT